MYITIPVFSVFLLSSLFFFLWTVVILVTPRCCWSDREPALILSVDLLGPGSVCGNVQKGIQDTWEGSEIPLKLLEATLIISRKRTMNFGDLVQRFNATYLESFPDVTTLGDLFQSLHL